ncbi:A24 family peptidase [Gordonia sp. 'Campus']|uniref:A24 family peptidase n=1 Tax=Gordonia sp. 'Campus' TaxID=2915824 RepID=UPI001EE492B6|nr:A24 family peptidase [Gordonia sp. 'Campus']
MTELSILVWLIAVADTDARTLRIPNRLVWPGIWAVAVVGVVHPEPAVAAVVAAAPYALCFGRRWCGGGDVKLAAVCGGLTLRWDAALLMVAVAASLSLGISAYRAVTRRDTAAHAHGPVLVAATVVVAGLL